VLTAISSCIRTFANRGLLRLIDLSLVRQAEAGDPEIVQWNINVPYVRKFRQTLL
jgi:hypothetical protein